MPSIPNKYDFGNDPKSKDIGSKSSPFDMKYDVQPAMARTVVPIGYFPFFDLITLHF